MSSPSTKTDPSAKPRPRWRRWLKRLLWTGFWLLLVLIVFHRPILRFTVNHVARYVAGSGGMDLKWSVDGSVVNGIDLRDIEVTGKPGAPVIHLKAGRIFADYSLWRAVSEGPGQFVDEVVLEDVDLDLDPDKFPASDPNKPKSEPAAPPRVKLPSVRLKNVNVRVRQRGGDIVVRGLNFTLNRNSEGVFEFDELQLPNQPALTNVKGTTERGDETLTLKSLILMPEVNVRSLVVDLQHLAERRIDLNAALTIPGGVLTERLAAGGGRSRVIEGSGDVVLTGSIEGLGKELKAKADLKIATLNQTTVAPWVRLPADLEWSVEEIDFTVNGPVNDPRMLKAAFHLNASGIRAGGVKLDKARIEGALEQGRLTAQVTEMSAGTNRLVARASSELPAAWADLAKMTIGAEASADFPEVAQFFTGQAPLTGQMNGKFTATVSQGKLNAATAEIEGKQWLTQGVPVQSLALKVDTDGRDLKVTSLRASLDANNYIDATATLGLTGNQPLEASWTASLPNLEKLGSFTGRKDLAGPDGGRLAGSGRIAGSLADWQRQDFSKTVSDMILQATAVKWKTGGLESLKVLANVADGRAELREFRAVINERNTLSASGSGALTAPWAFTAKVDGNMQQLTDLNGLMEAVGAQKFLSGNAVIQWEGSGTGGDLAVTGGGNVAVDALKMAGMTEPASLKLKTTHSGRRADVTQLEASLGSLKVSAPCILTDTSLEVAALKITAGKLASVEGKIVVPLDFTQKGGPAGPVSTRSALDINVTVKQLDIAEAGRAAGKKLDAKGKVDADIRISGTLLNPTAAIAMQMSGVSSGAVKQKLVPANASVTVNLKDRKLDALIEATQKPLKTLKITGSSPLDVEKVLRDPAVLKSMPLNVALTLPDSDLNGLRQFVDGGESMKGSLGLNATVTGTLASPRISGEFHATAPAITFKKDDVPDARDVKVRLKFDGTRVNIEEAGAMLAGGTVGARGSVDWTDAANPKIDAILTAREALVLRDDSLTMRANADITCRGSLQQSTVAGKVELVRGRVFKEIEFLPLSLPNQLPPAPPSVTVGKDEPPSLPPPFSNWQFNVDIVTKDQIRLLGNVLNGGVVSDLHFRGNGAKPVLEGKISLRDARVRLPFSRMTISRGDIIFTADKPFKPMLDVQGDSFVNSYQVTLNAYGSALDPKIRFTSSPPLPEGEIATLLATGSTSGDLRASEGEAANRAAFLLVSQMYRKMFRKGALAKESDTPPRLSFSFSLLNNSGGSRSFSAIYEINKNLQAVGAMSQTGSFRGLLYYLIRFR